MLGLSYKGKVVNKEEMLSELYNVDRMICRLSYSMRNIGNRGSGRRSSNMLQAMLDAEFDASILAKNLKGLGMTHKLIDKYTQH